MRTIIWATMSAAVMLTGMAVPAAAIQAGKYTAPIAIATGTVTIRATATFSDGSTSDRVYKVMLDADSDGDGVGDEVWLRVACADGAVVSAHTVKAPRDVATGQSSGKRAAVVSPRDPATGMATGKRQHGPVKIIKEWDRTAIVGQRVSWDLAKAKGEKTMAHDSWHQRTIRDGAANLCV